MLRSGVSPRLRGETVFPITRDYGDVGDYARFLHLGELVILADDLPDFHR